MHEQMKNEEDEQGCYFGDEKPSEEFALFVLATTFESQFVDDYADDVCDPPNGDAQEIGGYAGVGVANGDDTEDAGAEEEQGKEEKSVFAAEVEKTAE